MARAQLAGRVRAGVVGPCLPRPGRGTRPYSDSAASTANARPTATRTAPSASRNVRSDARPVAFAPSHAPGIAPASPAASRGQSTPAPPHRWRRRPGRGEPHRQVRTCSGADVHSDRPQQGRHPQRPQDRPDGAADQADHEPEGGSRPKTHVLARTRSDRPKRRSIPLHRSTAAISAKSAARGASSAKSAPGHSAGHRRRCHPGEHATVDAPCAPVRAPLPTRLPPPR